MSRIRTIKPEFWCSEQVVECSPSARLLFVGLWNFCDDAGRKPASPKRLKMEVFPGDDVKVETIREWVDELIANQLLLEYTVEGKTYWQVTGWHHQKIDKPTIKYPPPPDTMVSADYSPSHPPVIVEDSSNIHPRSLMEGSLRESKDIRRVANASRPDSADKISCKHAYTSNDVDELFSYWQQVLNHPKAKLDTKRRRIIKKALENYSITDLKKAIDGCVKSDFHRGQNDQHKCFDDIGLILRDSSKIEQFIGYVDNPISNHLPPSSSGHINNDIFAGAL